MAPTTITDGARLLRDWLAAPGESRSQTTLAERLGVSQPSVSAWLRGDSRPEDHHRESIQLLTGVPRESWRKPAEQAAVERIRFSLSEPAAATVCAAPAARRRHAKRTSTATDHGNADRLRIDRDPSFDQTAPVARAR